MDIGLVLAVCLTTGAIAVSVLYHGIRARGAEGEGTRVAVRFARGRLVGGDPMFLDLLTDKSWDGTFQSVGRFFSFRFPDLPAEYFEGSGAFDQTVPSRTEDDPCRLRLRRRNAVAWIELEGPGTPNVVWDHVRQCHAHYRDMALWITDSVPDPVWIADEAGKVHFANRASRSLEQDLTAQGGDGLSVLTGDDGTRSLPDREQRRHSVSLGEGKGDRWFDVVETRRKGARLFHATDVTAVIQAEAAQRTFVQTLTKTFAQLSIGLAIFDRTRRLALFNPALVDLTGLSADYLSGRPGYLSFFDKLRDEKMMPEPRNYATWREQILDLIAAAEDGRYQEVWTLPSGRTYRVTGRPHPNGAVAFLVEDISAEVTLTRRFREQLDLSQAVIESLEEAVAVFSPQGILSYTNQSYRDLWSTGTDLSTLNLSVSEASRRWQEQCEPSPVWGDFRDFVVGFEARSDWDATVRMRDGRPLDCRFRPLQGGATLATFRPGEAVRAIGIHSVG